MCVNQPTSERTNERSEIHERIQFTAQHKVGLSRDASTATVEDYHFTSTDYLHMN